MSINDIKELAGLLNIGIPICVALLVLIACIFNIDKLLLLLSAIQKCFSAFSQRARKGTISNSIRGRIMKSSKVFRSFGQNIMIADLKIDWVKEESEESFIKNNQVIIRMVQSSNPHKNYVTAVTTFVGQALLPYSKNYIDSGIYNLSKLSVGRLLVLNGDIDALDYFDKNILFPVIDSDQDAKDTFEQLKAIDKNGMFINILLNEYAKASQKIYPDTPDPLLAAESKELLTYLYRITIGNLTSPEELQFNREYFKIHIFLTAKTSTYRRSGIRPYLKHINDSLAEGIETIYIFGLGRKVAVAEEIAKSLGETDFRVTGVIPHYYRHKSIRDGRSIHGVCYEVSVYKETHDTF